MSFLGKDYQLESQNNFEEFLDSIEEISAELKKGYLAFKPVTKLTKDGDTYTLSSTTPTGTTHEVSFKSGVEFDEKVREHDAKTTYTVDGNTVTQVQKYENGVIFTFKREFTDDELITTITSNKWDGEAKRFYKAI